MERFVLLLSPFAPHVAEELWQRWATPRRWPTSPGRSWTRPSSRRTRRRCRCRSTASSAGESSWPSGWTPAALEAAALADEKIAELFRGKTIVKKIVVPGEMVNFVVK